MHWLSLGQLGKLIKTFKAEGVNKAIMAGQVKHKQIFSGILARPEDDAGAGEPGHAKYRFADRRRRARARGRRDSPDGVDIVS